MRIEQFKYLIEINKTQSISLAAQNLNITQQSLSRSIKIMEDELSCVLLNRTSKGVSLTPQGYITLQHAKIFMDTMQQLTDRLSESKELSKDCSGTLNILYMVGVDLNKLSGAIADFSAQYPKVNFTLNPTPIFTIITELMDNKSDFGLLLIPENYHLGTVIPKEQLKNFQAVPLYEENLLVGISQNSRLAKQGSISISSILKEPLILLLNNHENDISTHWLSVLLNQYGTPNFALSTSSMEIYLNAIADGVGIGILLRSTMKTITSEHKKNITLIPVRPSIKIFASCVYCQDRTLSPAMQAFLPYLKKQFKIS